MASTVNTPTQQRAQEERVDFRKLRWAAPLAIFGAAILNVIVREIAVLLGAIPQDHALLGVIPVAIATIVQVGLGVIVFALLGKFARRPISTFRIVAVVALILSLTNPIMVAMGMIPIPPGGGSLTLNPVIILTMMLMHVIAGVFTIWALTTQARET